MGNMPPLTAMSFIILSSDLYLVALGSGVIPGITLNMDPTTGVFGFLTPSNFVYASFFVGFLGGALCYASYGYVLKFFSPVVLCTALLFDPFVSQTLGCIFGLDKSPGILTLMGSLITLVGIYYVSIGG
jgi:hypothetical protein